jgi:hypothetical protein
MRLVPAVLAAVLAVACSSSSFALPDRTDRVRAIEDDLSQVISAARGGDDCEVRLLGEADDSSFVWAECSGSSGAVSAPMRVDGNDVEVPGDGSQYPDDVRRLFPAEIADAILSDQAPLRP